MARFLFAVLLVAVGVLETVNASFLRCRAEFYCTGGTLEIPSQTPAVNNYREATCQELGTGFSFCRVDVYSSVSVDVNKVLKADGKNFIFFNAKFDTSQCNIGTTTAANDMMPGSVATSDALSCTMLARADTVAS